MSTRRAAPPGLLTALVLLPTLRAQFIYDDTSIIRDNPFIRGWAALSRVWTTTYWPSDGGPTLGLYRPLQLALLSLVWNLGGGRAIAFHLYSMLLAAAVSIAVWWLLTRATGKWPAFVGAAWFATHPLHVEAIASVANSSELVVVLCIIGLAAVMMSAQAHSEEQTSPSVIRNALLASVLAAGALCAKESGLLAIPVALLTAWGWQDKDAPHTPFVPWLRIQRANIIASLLVTMLVIAVRLHVLGTPVAHGSIGAQGLPAEFAPRTAMMLALWPKIAEMLVVPHGLSPYYGPSFVPARAGYEIIIIAIVACCVFGTAVLQARNGERRPLAAFGWMLLTYLPASNLLTPTGQLISDRVLFGATLGVAMLVAWGLGTTRASRRTVALAVVMLLSAINATTFFEYASVWRTHRTLWARLAERMPHEHMSYKLQGMDARARGDIPVAIKLLNTAHIMAPTDRQIRFELGQALYQSARFAEAARMFEPLMHDKDASSEPEFVKLYRDAVARAAR